MIVYYPLWETLKEKGFTTYTLRYKFGISGSTVQRLRKNMSISTNTLDDICRLLNCKLSDLAEYVESGDMS
ncbi:MAG: helix-turn-helix transcriptional regulator [Oscillospiraceae bacterium]|nr:helix-turn-helix transcriptional regulator [Oscillospiraceae bacterium]